VVNGVSVYRAWWEMYSTGDVQPQQTIKSMTVMPGDSITASVQYITSGPRAGQFYLSIADLSQMLAELLNRLSAISANRAEMIRK
jgi:hypothetical protein